MNRKLNGILILFVILIISNCKSLSQQKESKVQNAYQYSWSKIETEIYGGKQDDIAFVDENTGWYLNGYGKIFHTKDGGLSWEKQLEQKGTFFRTLAFVDQNIGFAGTVGTDYYPNVTDSIPLYRTKDGGKNWHPVDYDGPYVKGLCALDVVKEQYIYQGETAFRNHIFGVGRVGSPANLMISHDSGITWRSKSMEQYCQMLLDIKMFNKQVGIACASTSADSEEGNALILKTNDGGETWRKVYQSNRFYENCWKVFFPSPKVGYATIQSYDPDPEAKQQRIVKTTDGGETWKELDLVEDKKARPFGIGFLNEKQGYVGTMNSGYETKDGGESWSPIPLGKACNKIKIYKDKTGKAYGYSIGVDVYKLIGTLIKDN